MTEEQRAKDPTPENYKVVWILGAGFSKFLGGPLLNDLFTADSLARLNVIYSPKLPWETAAGIDGSNGVYGMYTDGKPKSTAGEQWANAEAFLERLDLALENDAARDILTSWAVTSQRPFYGRLPHDLRKFRNDAVRLLAAECCLFLHGADPNLERWSPYVDWVRSLQPHDVVITFNYDRVVEIASTKRPPVSPKVLIPIPNELGDTAGCPIVLKMHGSVDWIVDNGMIRRAEGMGRPYPHEEAALHCDAKETAMGTPGTAKFRMTDQGGGPLGDIWRRAELEMRHADAIVMVGYSMPVTDAYSKQWVINRLRMRTSLLRAHYMNNGGRNLPVHTVLGTRSETAPRVAGLLTAIDPWIQHVPWDMGAEDFLGLVSREMLLGRETSPGSHRCT